MPGSARPAAGLEVHPRTFRSENFFLPTDLRRGDAADPAFLRHRGDAVAELRRFLELGVDSVFADHPADTMAAREAVRGGELRTDAARK